MTASSEIQPVGTTESANPWGLNSSEHNIIVFMTVEYVVGTFLPCEKTMLKELWAKFVDNKPLIKAADAIWLDHLGGEMCKKDSQSSTFSIWSDNIIIMKPH